MLDWLSRRRVLVSGAAAGAVAVLPALGLFGGGRAAAEGRPLVGFAQDDMTNDWRAAQVRQTGRALAALAPQVRFVHTDAQGSAARMVLDIDDLVSQGIDVLITSPRDPRILSPAIARAWRAGVHVVLLTRLVHGEDYTTFIAPDDREIARQAAAVLARTPKGVPGQEKHILMLQGVPSATTTIARTEGFLEGLKRHPGLVVSAILPANFLRADAIRAVEKALAEGIPFDGIYSQSDSMAVGARLALRAAGIDPASVPLVGIDYIPEARQAIRDGTQVASFTYPTCGPEGAEAAIALLNGQPVERHRVVPSVLVTRENVDAVEPVLG